MSFFKSIFKGIGSVAKTVGKIGLGVVGSTIGVDLSGVFSKGAGSSVQSATPVNVSNGQNGVEINPAMASTMQNGTVVAGNFVPSAPSLLEQLKGALLVASGNKPIEINATSSALPSWAIPAGILGALTIGFLAVRKK